MSDQIEKASLISLPSGSGDGYGFGGGAVISFAGCAIIVGEGRHRIAQHIVDAINAYKPLPDEEVSPF